ncbi:MAG: MBL fold metallo-hydrolase [Akkermansiaceae bacterium]|nr:MBL fold metallo-hydrolase [Armatimonadota bacterium]
MQTTTRRSLLRHGAFWGISLGAGASTLPAWSDPDTLSSLKPPALSLTEPALYAFKIGAMDAFVIHESVIASTTVQPFFAPEGKPDEIKRLLESAFQPTDRVTLSINVLVLRDRDGVTLFDAGGNAFGSAAGRLKAGLARLGIAPEKVTNIVLTHAHGDHIAGLLNADKKSAFPNAAILISKAEQDFWTMDNPDLSGMSAPVTDQKWVLQTARRFLTSLKSQIKTVAFGEKIGAITVVETSGHTPGHIALSIASGADSLLVVGDAVHLFALQFAHPEYTTAYDVAPKRAAETRRRLFADAAKRRAKIFSYHLPFPGIGHVRETGESYEWVPQPWTG